MPERTPKQILTNRMHGFSTAWRQGSDPEAYARNYERIFRRGKTTDSGKAEPAPLFETGDRVEVLHNRVLGNLIGTVIAAVPRRDGYIYGVQLDGGGVDNLYDFQIRRIPSPERKEGEAR